MESQMVVYLALAVLSLFMIIIYFLWGGPPKGVL